MSEKHENIEDFVRKVVDQSEAQIPFNESHWQQMESMLDAELPVISDPGTGYYYFSNVISLLVGSIFVWLWFTGINAGGSKVFASQESGMVEVAKELPGSEISSAKLRSDEASTRPLVNGVKSQDERNDNSQGEELQQAASGLISKSEVESTSSQRETEKDGSFSTNIEAVSERTEVNATKVPSKNEVSSVNTQISVNDPVVVNDQATKVQSPDTTQEEKQSVLTSRESVPLLVNDEENDRSDFDALSRIGINLNGGDPALPDELAKVEVLEPDGGGYDLNENPIINGRSRGPFSRFSVGVSLAPDLSSNQVFRYNRLGRDLGIVVDYWITPRLSFSVGAFNTSKRYLVGGEEYNPPAGFWGNITNGELPAKIDADCQVLDIPLNLKFQFLSRPNFSISASAGVSSYIMLREDYRYELDNGWQSEWGTRNENQHFFGVGNLQVHFERRLGKHFAFEVAPFFKAPLTSFGHGNIRFHSMGSFFTLRKYFLTR